MTQNCEQTKKNLKKIKSKFEIKLNGWAKQENRTKERNTELEDKSELFLTEFSQL